LEEEEHADSDDDGRTKQGADLAPRALASWVVAHRCSSLLRTDENLISAAIAFGSCDFFFVEEKIACHTDSSISETKMSATNSMLNPNTQPAPNLLRLILSRAY
jgi:hypothetical protein